VGPCIINQLKFVTSTNSIRYLGSHGYTQVPPVDVILLATFAKVVRLIDFANMIYNMKQQHWRSARMRTQDLFEDVTESSEESDVDHK